MPSLEAPQPSVAPARRPVSESCPCLLFLPNKRQACHQKKKKKRKAPLLHTGFCLDGVTDTLRLFTSASERTYPPTCFTAARPRQDACGLPLNAAFATQPRPPASVLPSATDTTSTRKRTRSWTPSTSARPNSRPVTLRACFAIPWTCRTTHPAVPTLHHGSKAPHAGAGPASEGEMAYD